MSERAEQAFRASPLFKELEAIQASGDYSVFDSQAKRQHFMPRFLLANFGLVSGGKERIYQLDVAERGTPLRVQTQLAASRHFFYGILEEGGNRNTRVEGFLALVESHAATALRAFLENPDKLSDADRATLSFFFGLQAQRTPSGIDRITQLAEAGMQMLVRTQLSDAESFAEDYEKVFGPASREEIENQRQEMIELLEAGSIGLTEESAKAQALANALRIGAVLGELIFDMQWELLLSTDGFVTSDRGLAIHDPQPPYPWTTQTVFSSPYAETTIPLATNVCLRLRVGEYDFVIVEAEQETVDEINLKTYGWAERFLFGHSEQLLSEVGSLAEQRPEDVVKPRPYCSPIVFERDPDDDSVADEHRLRGEPAYLEHEGVDHDYVLVKEGENAARVLAASNEKVRERAAKAMGLQPGETPPGAPALDFFGP